MRECDAVLGIRIGFDRLDKGATLWQQLVLIASGRPFGLQAIPLTWDDLLASIAVMMTLSPAMRFLPLYSYYS